MEILKKTLILWQRFSLERWTHGNGTTDGAATSTPVDGPPKRVENTDDEYSARCRCGLRSIPPHVKLGRSSCKPVDTGAEPPLGGRNIIFPRNLKSPFRNTILSTEKMFSLSENKIKRRTKKYLLHEVQGLRFGLCWSLKRGVDIELVEGFFSRRWG